MRSHPGGTAREVVLQKGKTIQSGAGKGNVPLFILDNLINYLSCSPEKFSKGHPSWVQCYYMGKPEYPEKTCDAW